VVFGTFEFQGIARADLQGVAYGFWQDHAARLVDGKSGIHNAVLPYKIPFVMAFMMALIVAFIMALNAILVRLA